MRSFLRLIGLSALVFFGAARAQAGELVLTFDGVTSTGSSLGDTAIAAGTGYDLQVTFSTPPSFAFDGIANFLVTAITAVVGGTSYSGTNPGYYSSVSIYDATNPIIPGYYVPEFFSAAGGPADPMSGSFDPLYTTSTDPTWAAANPTPTVFTGYVENDYPDTSIVTFFTASGRSPWITIRRSASTPRSVPSPSRRR